MNIYDVSLLISEDIPIWPGDPGISIRLSSSIARGDEANVTRLELGVHTGTHIDAPSHFEPDGGHVDDVPLAALVGPCRVIDMTAVKEGISKSLLEKLDFKGVTRVLFKTRNSEWWEFGEKRFQKGFVYLEEEAARFLIQQGIILVGLDYLSIEKFKNPGHPTHHTLLRHNIVIIEGLNLSHVSPGEYELIALPIKLKGADGAPARVVLREMQV